MIEVRGLAKRHGDRVILDGIDLVVPDGSIVAVTGANGAGKTTLLRCVAGLVAHEGEVRRPAPIGFLPQSPVLPPLATVGEIVSLFGSATPDRAAVRLGVAPTRRLEHLSGGEQQRVAIAALFALRPPLYLLDEPTADLDAEARRDLFAELARRRSEGATVILTTPAPLAHELDPLADRILVLEGGRLVDAAERDLAAVAR